MEHGAAPEPDTSSLEGESETAWDDRRCGRTKADGERCKAFKVGGQEACAGHLGLGAASDPKAYGAKGGQASGENRSDTVARRKMRLRDALAEAVEGDLHEDILAAYRDALRKGDPGERLKAAEQLISRVYGKPKETLEQVTKPDEVRRLEELSDEELFAAWAAARSAHGDQPVTMLD